MKTIKWPNIMKRVACFGFIWAMLLTPPTFSSQAEVKTYSQLIQAIRQTRQASTERIEQAVEQEKVREAWETGKLIDEHILHHKERADYGKQVLTRLSGDLAMSQTELSLMLQFFRAYPNYPQGNNLSWSHYRALLSINDEAERQNLAKRAQEEKWGRDRLREEVRKYKNAQTQSAGQGLESDTHSENVLPDVQPGKPGVYRIVRALAGPHQGKLVLDLGFSIYHELSEKEAKKFKDKDYVSVVRKGSSYKLSPANSTPKDLYTYPAYPYQAVDGDTFHAVIDLGFGVMIQQRIRLLRLDAPELLSADGKKAKEALKKILMTEGKGSSILIQSKELDQHGRPLANVFLRSLSSPNGSVGDPNTFQSIDPELLDSGYFQVRGDA